MLLLLLLLLLLLILVLLFLLLLLLLSLCCFFSAAETKLHQISFLSFPSLIVVSNRLPFVLKRDPSSGQFSRQSSAGGLVTAVAPVVVQSGGLWVGWPGTMMEDGEKIPVRNEARKKKICIHGS